MGNDFFSRLSKVSKSRQDYGKPLSPGPYMLAGKQIECPHCGNTSFIEGNAQVNTTIKSAILGLDYKKVSTLVCSQCGFLQWMMQEPTRMLDESLFS